MTQEHIFMASYEFNDIVINDMIGNKLFCTFIAHDRLDEVLGALTNRYSILYNK